MNKILKLFDEDFVRQLFQKKVLPKYKPKFREIGKIEIIPHKRGIWGEEHYHTVLEFKTHFIDYRNKTVKIPIFCSAHSHEPRKNVFTVLDYLWKHNFSAGNLTVPHPLFYSQEFRATFYRGAKGKTMYSFIRHNDRKSVERINRQAAAWFAKLHRLPVNNAKNFNKNNSRIGTVVPGVKRVLENIDHKHPEYREIFEKAYEAAIAREKQFFSKGGDQHLVHGDAHPDNVIMMSKSKIAVIDFTDLCLSDFARDLGTFCQQINYMCTRKIDGKFAKKMQKDFLNNYLKCAKIKMTSDLNYRIDTYYGWTAMRTAVYFLIKDRSEPDRALPLIEEFRGKLNI